MAPPVNAGTIFAPTDDAFDQDAKKLEQELGIASVFVIPASSIVALLQNIFRLLHDLSVNQPKVLCLNPSHAQTEPAVAARVRNTLR